jgi:hypothetical protein
VPIERVLEPDLLVIIYAVAAMVYWKNRSPAQVWLMGSWWTLLVACPGFF